MEGKQKRLVLALSGSLGCALLLIAFLLGRMTARPAVVAVPAPSPTIALPQAPDQPLEPLSDKGGEISGAVGLSPALVEPAGFLASPREIVPTRPEDPSSPPSPSPSQIAAYFNQIDRIDDMGAGDPRAFATSLVESMSSGDFSGFDRLLAKSRVQRQRLLDLTPPPACVEHHRLALTLSGDSVTMLEQLKAALVKGDAAQLLSMAEKGRTLETQANQLKTMSEQIKRQAGF